MSFLQTLSQMRPPAPEFTEAECSDQTGKVFFITGGYSGRGLELATQMYRKNALVYVVGRSISKADPAILHTKESSPSSKGALEFIFLDLIDLTTIKPAVEKFKAQSNRLDVLWNNAGIMVPPQGSKTIQGYEMQLGSNCLAYFLLTKLLYSVLLQTAASAPPNSVRVCWTGSLVAELKVPKGVVNLDDINFETGCSQGTKYGQSKAANILLASEFAKRDLHSILLYPPVYGAYTEMFAGLSPAITADVNGSYIIPWGRIAKLKPNLEEATRSEAEGGTGVASKFNYSCEAEVAKYL